MENTALTDGRATTESRPAAAKARMPEQDIAKGIAILLVIALHTLKLHQNIYVLLGGLVGFIMPFFFFMAGYNHRPGKYTYKEIIKRRAKQLLKPMLIYSIAITVIAAVYLISTGQIVLKDALHDYIIMFLTRPCAKWFGVTESSILYKTIMFFWFIQMLFVASLVFYAVVDYALAKASRFISVVAGLIAVTLVFAHFNFHLPFYLSEAPAIAAIMLFGALFGKYALLGRHAKTKTIAVNAVVAYGAFLVLASMFKGAGFIMGGFLWTADLREGNVLLSVAFAILGSYAFVHACRCLVKTGPLGKALSWCGNNSMELLFLHGIVQLFVCAPLKLEPFRMSIKSEESDYRTFLVLALEILFTVLLILVIKFLKKKMSRKV